MLKKLISLLLLVMICCCGCGKKEATTDVNNLDNIIKRDKLIVGVKVDAYPFGYQDKNGRYLGVDPALARLIAKDILGSDKKVEFVPVNSTNRIMKLYAGDVDMLIATMSVTPKRKEILDFSTPYHVAGQALLVRKGSKIKQLRDLRDKRAIIVFGSTSEKSLKEVMPSLSIIGYKTYPEALRALKTGKAEAIVSDDTILMGLAYKDNSLEVLPKKYTNEPYAVALRKGPESDDLLNTINGIIEIERKTGNFEKIKANYIAK